MTQGYESTNCPYVVPRVITSNLLTCVDSVVLLLPLLQTVYSEFEVTKRTTRKTDDEIRV